MYSEATIRENPDKTYPLYVTRFPADTNHNASNTYGYQDQDNSDYKTVAIDIKGQITGW